MTNAITEKISERLMRPVWLFTNILGKYSDAMAYDEEKEQAKKILYEVYWYKDIYNVCPSVIDEDKMKRFLDTVFTYHEELPSMKK